MVNIRTLIAVAISYWAIKTIFTELAIMYKTCDDLTLALDDLSKENEILYAKLNSKDTV